MKSILDQCHAIFLDKVIYLNSLEIYVSEGILSDETQSLEIGQHIIENLKEISSNKISRQFKIEFDSKNLINFQFIDESFTAMDEKEKRDTKGFLQIIQNSKYLDYVEKSHGWYKDVVNREAQHFRILTVDDVIDIVSLDEPIISEIKN